MTTVTQTVDEIIALKKAILDKKVEIKDLKSELSDLESSLEGALYKLAVQRENHTLDTYFVEKPKKEKKKKTEKKEEEDDTGFPMLEV
ncbi:MAG: hypothetical protein M0R66_03865 [Candidatus Omnitrophica bacterium]|nr:hypothetical protein [Candidatus Omnitrophota bacterium]